MKANMFFKRCFDIIASFLGIILLSPVLLIIGFSVKCTSKGPVFFKQIRIGRYGKQFKILKFRTMFEGSDKKGLSITVGADSRITGAGKFLRKTKLDELPQLFNVFIGDMSFVGPRPEVPKYVEMYNERQREVLKIRPGITDYASIYFRNESELLAEAEDPEREYIENIMPAKIEYSLKYMKEMNVFLDIKIIFSTLFAVSKG